MKVQDFKSQRVVHTTHELESVLAKRYENGFNSFWLYPGDDDVPSLLILVVNDLSYLHFFPSEHHPGFSSVGSIDRMDSAGTSVFYMDGMNAPQDVNNDTIIRFSKAVEAAGEFFSTGELPKCVDWTEL